VEYDYANAMRRALARLTRNQLRGSRADPRHMLACAAICRGALWLRVSCRYTYSEKSAAGLPASPGEAEVRLIAAVDNSNSSPQILRAFT
jgi:hypothetical protein